MDIPVLALGGSAFVSDGIETQARNFAVDVTTHVFDAGHDLAEEVPSEMADVLRSFLSRRLVDESHAELPHNTHA